jgi:hypothetical protein
MADAKRIAKQVLRGFGKGLWYVGKGLWWFIKVVARDIQRSYRQYQERERLRAIRQAELDRITEENIAAGKGWAIGTAQVREQERIRRQNERDQREYWKNLNRMYEVPQVNENAFFGDSPNRKKKKRSMFDY